MFLSFSSSLSLLFSLLSLFLSFFHWCPVNRSLYIDLTWHATLITALFFFLFLFFSVFLCFFFPSFICPISFCQCPVSMSLNTDLTWHAHLIMLLSFSSTSYSFISSLFFVFHLLFSLLDLLPCLSSFLSLFLLMFWQQDVLNIDLAWHITSFSLTFFSYSSFFFSSWSSFFICSLLYSHLSLFSIFFTPFFFFYFFLVFISSFKNTNQNFNLIKLLNKKKGTINLTKILF